MEAVFMGDGLKGVEVDVEPGEGGAFDGAVLHLVLQFAVVFVVVGQIDDAVLILKDVTDVGGVEEELSAVVEDVADVGEKVGEAVDGASNADAVHQHEYGVKFLVYGEEVLVSDIVYATGCHRFAGEG